MRRPLSPLEKKIYNHGERLIFGISHDIKEDIRHRSSYIFFTKIIKNDLTALNSSTTIIDLGCGVGHGCETLSRIRNSTVLGIDNCQDAIDYAREVYFYDNISYKCLDLLQYIPVMPAYDYVVSRGVLEHIPNGLELGFSSNWKKRLMFDVPYNEPKNRNHHHLLSEIQEKDFSNIDAELFYQDLNGVIYDKNNKPVKPNMIICICTAPALPRIVNSQINFPMSAWKP